MPTAELIVIGSEFLLGESLDTNSRVLARALRRLGIALLRIQTVGDDAAAICQAVRSALDRADIVLTTGGLGPTVDDPTRQAIAEALERELEFHPELWEQVVACVARYGRVASENQRRQAYIPRGAIAIANPVGTAPAFLVERGRQTMISLPGVPREMETLLEEHILPYLRRRYNVHAVTKVRTLHVAGLGESAIDEQIGEFERSANPTVGLAAHAGLIDIRLTASAETEARADELLDRLEEDIRHRLGEAIFGTEEETLEAVTMATLSKRGWTLAVYEAGMNGAILQRLASLQGNVYLGGTQGSHVSESLAEATKHVQHQYHAQVALGIQLKAESDRQSITIVLLSPLGAHEWHLSYGGHPAYAPQWAANMALDRLRRFAIGKETS